jgi:hypothetical protein
MKHKKIVYVSGPMSGYPNFNYDRFNQVTAELRKRGYEVINPVELQGEPTTVTYDDDGNSVVDPLDWVELLSRDLRVILDRKVEQIILLDGWEKSKGAKAEVFIVKEILGGDVLKYEDIYSGGYILKEISVDTNVTQM